MDVADLIGCTISGAERGVGCWAAWCGSDQEGKRSGGGEHELHLDAFVTIETHLKTRYEQRVSRTELAIRMGFIHSAGRMLNAVFRASE